MRILSLFTFAVCLFVPCLALANETTIIPPAPPPVGTDWLLLAGIGAGYVFAGVEIAKKALPTIDGWKTPVIAVPIAALAVSLYQVGYADPKLLIKHAGVLYATAYGGTVGLRKIFSWTLAAYAAYKAGASIPPPPSMVSPATESVAPSSPRSLPKPPPLPLITCLVLSVALLACGALPSTNPCAVAYTKAADCKDCSEQEILARVEAVDKDCGYMLEPDATKIGGAGGEGGSK